MSKETNYGSAVGADSPPPRARSHSESTVALLLRFGALTGVMASIHLTTRGTATTTAASMAAATRAEHNPEVVALEREADLVARAKSFGAAAIDRWVGGAARNASSSTEALGFAVASADYGALPAHTLAFYKRWDYVVEPSPRATVLRATGGRDGASFEWRIARADGAEAQTLRGAVVEARFASVTAYYSIELRELSPASARGGGGGAERTARSANVVCKRVRREIRTLTDADREAYLSALEVLHTVDDAEGRRRYGADFANGAYFAKLHNANKYCYHNNLAFLTTHPAFTLQVENMLLRINASAPSVYWDFMADHQYGGRWYLDSPMYRPDWFGTLDNGAEDGYRIRGRFRDVKVARDLRTNDSEWTMHSPYGFVSNNAQMSDSVYLQRTNQFCGLSNTQGFPSCNRLVSCFANKTGLPGAESNSLLDWDLCIENFVHANLHGQHGGYFDCASDANLAQFATENAWASQELLSFLSVNIAEEIVTKYQTIFDYYVCPDPFSCELGVDSLATCHCASSVPDVSTLNDTQVYEYISDPLSKLHEGYEGPHFMGRDATNRTIFATVTAEQDLVLKRLYLQMLQLPGNFGSFATGAAANDPLFWPMHPIFEKITQALRLAPTLYGRDAPGAMNYTWDNGDSPCGGENGTAWGDRVPFENLFVRSSPLVADDDGGGEAGRLPVSDLAARAANLGSHELEGSYSNEELWELFRPDGDAIPHIFDQLTDWGECEWDPLLL